MQERVDDVLVEALTVRPDQGAAISVERFGIRTLTHGLRLEQLQAACETAARERTGHRKHGAGAVANFQRHGEPRPVAGEVRGIDRHAELGEVGKQGSGRGTFIETAQTFVGETAQGRGKRRQRQSDRLPGPRCDRRQAGRQPQFSGVRVLAQLGCGSRHHLRRVPVDREASIGQCCRGRDQLSQRYGAEALVGDAQAVGKAGDRYRQRAMQVAVPDHGRPAEQVPRHASSERVVGGIEAARRHHAAIDGMGAAIRQPDQHGAAAAEPAHPGLDHTQRQRGGDGGIDRVAAVAEHLGADRCRKMVLCRHDAAARTDRALAHLPGVRAQLLIPSGGDTGAEALARGRRRHQFES